MTGKNNENTYKLIVRICLSLPCLCICIAPNALEKLLELSNTEDYLTRDYYDWDKVAGFVGFRHIFPVFFYFYQP